MKKIIISFLLIISLLMAGCQYQDQNESQGDIVNLDLEEKRELISANVKIGVPVSEATLVFNEGAENASFLTADREVILNILSQEYLISSPDINSVVTFEE